MERYFSKPPLLESSQFVKGVGPARQVLLSRLGIETVEDLLFHFPRAYYDRRDLVNVAEIPAGAPATFLATVLAVSTRKIGRGRSVLTVAVGDETGIVNLIFFNQPYLAKYFKQGAKVVASGEMNVYRGRQQVVAPEYEIMSGDLGETLLHTGRIVPVYPLTAGISQRMMRRIVKAAVEKTSGKIPENLTAGLRKRFGFPGREEALMQVHFPDGWDELEKARRRLKFEEVFFLHLHLKGRRRNVLRKRPRPSIEGPHRLMECFIAALPFDLTAAQLHVLEEIRRDMVEGRGLNRLVQGDVGSGKTIVGVAAMAMAVGNGYQAALMVPTEILAQQHYERIRRYFEKLPVRVELLIGSVGRVDKNDIQRDLMSGAIDMIVGTHALIQEGISFRQLGLAVIDEQHRFGVRQRARLGEGDLLPHFLVMTATPIPRSLAQTVYGDLDLSLIDEMPAGERNVRTELVGPGGRAGVYEKLRNDFRSGQQAFILYPLVQESERSDLLAATEEFEKLRREEFGEFPLGLLHGKMSFEEKSKAISMFREKEVLGLVTTTVIEVGVDIPNASVLLINNPERFGLAQLHQLRGRIGRGGTEGRCYLLMSGDYGERSFARLRFFAATKDGFRVAEEDLRMRGPGEVWGFRQSGLPSFRLINPLRDNDIVQSSWEESERILSEDSALKKPENRVVADYFRVYYKPRMELADIG